MVACQQCGVEFFNEFEPLSTICQSCKEEESDAADAYWEKYLDWVDDTHYRDSDDDTDPLIQYEDGWR
jgi:hypothetical protein